MGVIYKLKPEIIDFILEHKKSNSVISCRGLTNIIEQKFQIKVSKSSINSIIKQAGLSMPVGRRLRHRRRKKIVQILPEIEAPVAQVPPALEVPPVEVPPAPEPPPVPVPEIKQPEEPVIPEAIPEAVSEPIQPEIKPEIQIDKVEVPLEPVCTGAIFLKAADFLLGGSYHLTEAIKNRLNREEKEILTNTELLIYMQLFGLDQQYSEKDLSEFWSLVGRRISKEEIISYLNTLQSVKTIAVDVLRVISSALQEVRCIKTIYPDGSVIYLDGQLHTVWSTPHMPYDFSSTIYNIKSYINQYFYQEPPFMLFMAPGYDTPTREFFNFILNLDSQERSVIRLGLYNNKFEELEVLTVEHNKRRFFVFGLWPWQFLENRKVKNIGEFRPIYLEAQKKNFYIAPIEMDLSQPSANQSVALRGVALKTSLEEKTRLVILTNLPGEQATTDYLTKTYINHWPNLEETFQDYSRKIELFTYTANSQRFFSVEGLNLNMQAEQDISALLGNYLKVLDLYVKWHFLPSGSEDLDFNTIQERFYSLKARIEAGDGFSVVTFQPPPGYPQLRELEYACRRINEKEIKDHLGRRVWLKPKA